MKFIRCSYLSFCCITVLVFSSSGVHSEEHRHRAYRIRHGSGIHAHIDRQQWRRGRWMQTWHGQRYGWWWHADTFWVLYSNPVYPYPNPATVPLYIVEEPVVPTSPSPSYPPPPGVAYQPWYFCPGRGFYPNVLQCPTGWQILPAIPADSPPPTP